MLITIRYKPADVIPLLNELARHADADKNALGFWPRGAYDEAAYQGKLLVATTSAQSNDTYVAHLLYGGVYPHARIFQLYVAPKHRGSGVAKLLVNHLKQQLVTTNWISVQSKVADDLSANEVWEKLGFRIVRTKPGGAARGRTINVRVLDLDTPTLFSLPKPHTKNDVLRLRERFSPRPPVYLLDLNVIFDIVRSRPRATDANKVIQAALNSSIRLMISEEFKNELVRNSQDVTRDPLLALVKQVKTLPLPPTTVIDELKAKLAPILFPDRSRDKLLSDRDFSDIVHISTAIHHRAAGFITNEKAILRAHTYLHDEWGIDVIGVEEFARIIDIDDETTIDIDAIKGEQVVRVHTCDSTKMAQARSFLSKMRVPAQIIDELLQLNSDARRILVSSEQQDLGFAIVESHGGIRRAADIFVCVDEGHAASEAVVEYLLDTISRNQSGSNPSLLRLTIRPGHSLTRRIAIATGFSPPDSISGDETRLHRVAIGRPVLESTWKHCRHSLSAIASINLPNSFPTYGGPHGNLSIGIGTEPAVDIKLLELERIFSPVLFLFSGRDGAIIPIRQNFAKDLLNASKQLSMFGQPEAVFRRERVYVSSSRAKAKLADGMLVLFYESLKNKGRGAVVAAARMTESRLVSKDTAWEKVQIRGVLNKQTLKGMSADNLLTEMSFDNIFVLKKPVTLKRLREIGGADGANFVTIKKVSADIVSTVISEGLSDD